MAGLARGVVVLHLAFVVAVPFGGFLALRWPRLIAAHVALVAWSIGLVVAGWECPLTHLERWLVARSGGEPPTAGFVDRFVEGVLFPESLTPLVRLAVGALVAVSWLLVARSARPNGGATAARVSP